MFNNIKWWARPYSANWCLCEWEERVVASIKCALGSIHLNISFIGVNVRSAYFLRLRTLTDLSYILIPHPAPICAMTHHARARATHSHTVVCWKLGLQLYRSYTVLTQHSKMMPHYRHPCFNSWPWLSRASKLKNYNELTHCTPFPGMSTRCAQLTPHIACMRIPFYKATRHVFSRGALLNQTTWSLVTELESKHTTAMIRRHVAIRFCKPKVVTNFLWPQTSWANNRHTLWFVPTWLYKVCGQRITKYRAKKSISYENKAVSAELKIAFVMDTSGDDVNIHPEMFCMHCKLSMERTICAITKGVHHKCVVILFEWQKHTD